MFNIYNTSKYYKKYTILLEIFKTNNYKSKNYKNNI